MDTRLESEIVDSFQIASNRLERALLELGKTQIPSVWVTKFLYDTDTTWGYHRFYGAAYDEQVEEMMANLTLLNKKLTG